MQISEEPKPKIFYFAAFFLLFFFCWIYIKFWTFWKKNEPPSLNISEVIDFERRAYLNA